MEDDLIRRHAGPVPRYTSYPTAPHFHDGIDEDVYRDWLGEARPDQTLSLYMHVPFCDTLCWFCGCHTRHTLRYSPLTTYLPKLYREIETVAGLMPGSGPVRAIHWGGGSPTMMTPRDMLALAAHTRSAFATGVDTEFSVEIDPRELSDESLDALAEAGVTRASIGVQDFDPKVQKAINRIQTVEETANVIAGLRRRGIGRINIDMIYGLPHQTITSLSRTVEDVVSLRPGRIALFGYAHVPWMKTHQKMIPESALPGPVERFRQSQFVSSMLLAAGYRAIGMDHFALPDDTLALAAGEGRLRRNFQGYTDDPADILLGFGASSIGQLPQGYIQNVAPIADYQRRVDATGLAVAKGFALDADDRLRAHVIERLICDFAISRDAIEARFPGRSGVIFAIAEAQARADRDGLVDWDGDLFVINPKGRPFVRTICARFDRYLMEGAARHSMAV